MPRYITFDSNKAFDSIIFAYHKAESILHYFLPFLMKWSNYCKIQVLFSCLNLLFIVYLFIHFQFFSGKYNFCKDFEIFWTGIFCIKFSFLLFIL